MKINDDHGMYNGCVYLDGTQGNSTWRQELISKFEEKIPYYDPQILEKTAQTEAESDVAKWSSDYDVFVVTSDDLTIRSGFELCEQASFCSEKLIFAAIGKMSKEEARQVEYIQRELIAKKCRVCYDLDEIAKIVNSLY